MSRLLYVVKCLENEHKRQNNANKLNEIISFLKNVDIPRGILSLYIYIINWQYLDNEELITFCTTLQQYTTDILLTAQYINSSLQHS